MIGKVLEQFKYNIRNVTRESFINMFYKLKYIHIILLCLKKGS